MGIFVFPTGGGGVDLAALTETAIDLSDGSWTALDPDSIVSGLAVASGVHTVTMNAISSGSTDYSLTTGANFRAWRRYKALVDSNGDPITTESNAIVRLTLDYDAPTSGFNQQVCLMVCEAPSTTTAASVLGVGLNLQRNPTVRWGVLAGTAGTIDTNGSNDKITTDITIRGGAYAHVGGLTLDVSGNAIAAPDRAEISATASTALYLMVSVGVLDTSAVSSGADTKFSASYEVLGFA